MEYSLSAKKVNMSIVNLGQAFPDKKIERKIKNLNNFEPRICGKMGQWYSCSLGFIYNCFTRSDSHF